MLFKSIKTFFKNASLLTRESNPRSKHYVTLTREVVNALVNDLLKKHDVEDLSLNEVLARYRVLDLVDVSIGVLNDEFYYVIKEPKLTDKLLEHVVEEISTSIVNRTPLLSIRDALKLKSIDPATYFYFKVVSGFGPLTSLILDPNVEDVHLSKLSGRAYVLHSGFAWLGWLRTNIRVHPELVDRLVMSVSRRIGKHVSLAQPIAEGSLGGDVRVSLVYGNSVSPAGSSLVIRKKRGVQWTITKLINENVISSIAAAYLWLVLELRGWIVIAGHVGAGKTTLLQSLLSLIPPNKKVVTIEDSPEVASSSELWDPLVEKSESFSSAPQIDAFALLKFALRRRPDYIVIGEVRGAEARLLVQASRLGHGVLNTIHADSPQSVLERLMSTPISIPRNLLNNIWSIVLIELRGKSRKVTRISEVDEDVSLVDVSSAEKPCTPENVVNASVKLRRLFEAEDLYKELLERTLFLEKLVSRGVFSAEGVSRAISKFYTQSRDVEIEGAKATPIYIQ